MPNSKSLFTQAKKLIPAGVNSPVRYFAPYPFFVKKAQGGYIWAADGNKYLDFCAGYGAMLLGHKRKEIIGAVQKQLKMGTMYGAPTDLEVELAKLITRIYPSMHKIRLVNTGAEATMTAIRLARGFTKKKKMIKFEGCYHGAHESMLVKAGSAHHGMPISAGVPDDFSKNTLVVQYNNAAQLESVIKKNNDVAGVIVEPVLGNMGLILPNKNFLQDIRKITKQHNIPLIFDEIITGFRLSLGGAQQYFGITPDITTLGKSLSNGFVISAVGGKSEIMDNLAPLGEVYEASTFAGNPISVTAAIASIKTMSKLKHKIYPTLADFCSKLTRSIDETARDLKIPHQVNAIGSMFQVFFTDEPVVDYASSKKSDTKKFEKLFKNLLKKGVFVAPSQFETVFISYAHTHSDIEHTINAYEGALKAVIS
ncbi:MAG TPA: glutamate-1-semialdehyde 2,1-aminomutase [Candidatus Nitrosotenuis sp.]|nr:glutamate-1-semialdehyde 2,1-aminomutase [Candidatus Nitrosotenuis sp.]